MYLSYQMMMMTAKAFDNWTARLTTKQTPTTTSSSRDEKELVSLIGQGIDLHSLSEDCNKATGNFVFDSVSYNLMTMIISEFTAWGVYFKIYDIDAPLALTSLAWTIRVSTVYLLSSFIVSCNFPKDMKRNAT